MAKSEKLYIITNLLKPINLIARCVGITHKRPPIKGEKTRLAKTSISKFFLALIATHSLFQLASAILIAILLHALWKTPNATEVLHYLTFVEVNVATIVQGIICYITMLVQGKNFAHHLLAFIKLNPLLESRETTMKKTSAWFFGGFFVSYLIQTGCWIAMITTNYPNDHVFFAPPNKYGILAVIYVGIVSMMTSQYLFQATYLLLVYVLGNGFETLSVKMEMALNNISDNSVIEVDSWLSKRLFKIRQYYQFSVELALKNDQIFSPILLTALLTNAVIAGVTLYQMVINLFYEAKVWSGLILGSTGIVSFGWIATLCMVPHSSATKASTSLISVFSTPMSLHLPHSQNELKIIAIKISGQPLTFTASEFITLSRSSFTQITSVCLTYIVGMIQFRQERRLS